MRLRAGRSWGVGKTPSLRDFFQEENRYHIWNSKKFIHVMFSIEKKIDVYKSICVSPKPSDAFSMKKVGATHRRQRFAFLGE